MSFGPPQNIPNTPSQTSHAEGIWMFDGFLIEGNHSLDVCVKYILADTCHTPWNYASKTTFLDHNGTAILWWWLNREKNEN